MSLLIQVENFKSVKKAKINVEGLTVLKGESNAGKSSFLKAIYQATHNRFKGNTVHWGQEAAIIKIKASDDPRVLTVTRKMAGGSPIVKLGNLPAWSKLNREMPTEVEQFIKMGTVAVSSSEKYSLNFFGQFKAPLLVGFSPKKVMDILATSKASDDLILLRKELELHRERVKGAFESIDSLMNETKEDLHQVGRSLEKMDKVPLLMKGYARNQELKELYDNHERLLYTLEYQDYLTEREAGLKMAVQTRELQDKLQTKFSQLVTLLDNVQTLKEEKVKISRLNVIITNKPKIDAQIKQKQGLEKLLSQIQFKSTASERITLITRVINAKEFIEFRANEMVKYIQLGQLIQKRPNPAILEFIFDVIQMKQEAGTYYAENVQNKITMMKLNQLLEKVQADLELDAEITRLENMINSGICDRCGKPLNQH